MNNLFRCKKWQVLIFLIGLSSCHENYLSECQNLARCVVMSEANAIEKGTNLEGLLVEKTRIDGEINCLKASIAELITTCEKKTKEYKEYKDKLDELIELKKQTSEALEEKIKKLKKTFMNLIGPINPEDKDGKIEITDKEGNKTQVAFDELTNEQWNTIIGSRFQKQKSLKTKLEELKKEAENMKTHVDSKLSKSIKEATDIKNSATQLGTLQTKNQDELSAKLKSLEEN